MGAYLLFVSVADITRREKVRVCIFLVIYACGAISTNITDISLHNCRRSDSTSLTSFVRSGKNQVLNINREEISSLNQQ
jgi:hypothetical protein